MNYEKVRSRIADKALTFLRELARDDPDQVPEAMQDANQALMSAGLLPMGISRKLPLPEFVDKMFRYNPKLDEATGMVPFRVLMAAESLPDLAHRLTPPYNLR